VRHQGAQDSCVAWAIAYYYRSYQEGIEWGRIPTTDREIFSPAFIYNQRITSDCERDWGMTAIAGLRIAIEKGVASLATMPYDPNDTCSQPSDEALIEAERYRSERYGNLFMGEETASIETLRRHLATGDPFILVIPFCPQLFQVTHDNPIIDVPDNPSSYSRGHVFLAVGYDDAAETFKVVNSWGPGWAEDGFAYVTYDFVRKLAWEGWVLYDRETPKWRAYLPMILQ